jgi:hypothetical protein
MQASIRPEHSEIEDYSAESSENPSAGDFNISLSIPKQIEIRMVDASTLSDYEIWFFASSSLLSFVVGFTVAFSQEADAKAKGIYLVVTLIFVALLVGCLIMTFVKRYCLRKKGKTVLLKTSRVVEKPNG